MAECVSCGKRISEGELFCRECLSRMKGKSPRLSSVERPGGNGLSRREEATTVKDHPREEGVFDKARRARGELTPAGQKKVVSLRPTVEEKKTEKGAFRITITLSERGYRLLSRLGLGAHKRERGGERRKKGGVVYLKPVPGGMGHLLKDSARVGEEKTRKRGELLSSLLQYLSPRQRDWDRADRISALTILASTFLAAALFPWGWVRVEWLTATEASPYKVAVKGTQLGAWSYLVLALVLINLLYLLLWFVFRRPPLPLDFGALSLVAGFLSIAFFNLALSSNARIIRAAAAARGFDPQSLSTPQAGLSRFTLLPAYLILVCLIAMSLAGLARLSRRE